MLPHIKAILPDTFTVNKEEDVLIVQPDATKYL